MELNEIVTLDDRGFIEISGEETKDFLQNIVTNDLNKIKENFTIFSSIFTPQGKYLYEFFIYKTKDKYLLECEKEIVFDIIIYFKIYFKYPRYSFCFSIMSSSSFSAWMELSTTGSASKAFNALALDFSSTASAVRRITLA